MTLAAMYTELHRRAAMTGEDRRIDLKGGARLAVRVRGDTTTLTISRKGKPLGATEIEVFKRDCGVPSSAERLPDAGQRERVVEDVTWHCVSYRWRKTE